MGARWLVHGQDVTGHSGWRGKLWPDGVPGVLNQGLVSLAGDGFVSPLGFAFRPPTSSEQPLDDIHIAVHEHAEPAAVAEAERRRRAGVGMVRTVSMTGSKGRHGGLTLVVGIDGADVFANEATWKALGEAVLLVVAQYARYARVEHQFLTLQNQAFADHRHATRAGLATLRDRTRLIDESCLVRDQVGDWIAFGGPSADPRRSCSSELGIEAYGELSEELGLDEWAKGIDDIVVDVEQTYEAISDKLLHYRLFMWGVVMEIVIIVLIVGLLLH